MKSLLPVIIMLGAVGTWAAVSIPESEWPSPLQSIAASFKEGYKEAGYKIVSLDPEFKVWTSREQTWGTVLRIQYLTEEDEITVNKVIVNNNPKCIYGGGGSQKMKFGDLISYIIVDCSILKVEIETDKGIKIYKFD